MKIRTLFLSLTLGLLGASSVQAACTNTNDFGEWLGAFKQEAVAAGLSKSVVNTALNGVTYQSSVIKRDRSQGVFSQTFLQFSDRMVNQNRLDIGRSMVKKYANSFAKVEAQYGVPGAVIASFWGLETDYGSFLGDFDAISALATLAYDCRRPDRFRPQLFAALQILDHGDLTRGQMRGAWAGEIGMTQFLPEDYVRYGVDADGDGKVNLRDSRADVFASSANLLRSFGWKKGEPWLEEVRLPGQMEWSQASRNNKISLTQWGKWGVTTREGAALKGNRKAALILPMGRKGPAFLAYDNFDAYQKWNQSSTYSLTAAYFATRLAGKKRVGRGNGEVVAFRHKKVLAIQKQLVAHGYDVGGAPDGWMGIKTRAAVRAAQLKYGLPADGYPTPALVQKLR